MNIKKFEIIFIVIFMSIISISFYVSGAEEEIYIENSKLDEIQITRLDDSQEIVISDETRSKVSIKDLEEYIEKNYIDSKENLITARAAVPEGCLDFVNGDEVSGWAWRSSSPNDPINVKITLGNVTTGQEFIKEFSARYYREDLKNAGIGNGYHKFSYAIDQSDYPPGNYLVSAYAYIPNKDVELNNSYKRYYRQGTAYVIGGIYNEAGYKINSKTGAENAFNTYASMGFYSILDYNPTYSKLKEKINGRRKIESDILFIISHGKKTAMEFLNGGLRLGDTMNIVISGKDNREVKAIGTNEINWKKVSLVILAGCKTGEMSSSLVSDNLAMEIDKKGAGATIGFKDEVEEESLFKWCRIFNENLKEGKTIQTCISNVILGSYDDVRVKDFVWWGNTNLRFLNSAKTYNVKIDDLEKDNLIIPKENIYYDNIKDINNVTNFLENQYKDFKKDKYEVQTSEVTINNDRIPVIDFKYKIGNFYTENVYTVMVEKGKVSKIADNTINFNLSKEKIIELENFNLSEEQITQYKNRALNDIVEDEMKSNIGKSDINYRFFYDISKDKKYIEIIIKINNGKGDSISVQNRKYEI